MARAELQKLRHDHIDIITRSVQPLLWLFIFGSALRHNRALAVGVAGALVLLVLGTGAFACMSMTIAAGVRTRERFMGIGQLIMMPLFFASSALHPLTIMPGWLHVVARVNPLTYEVQGPRQMLLGVGAGGELWLDFLIVIAFFVAMAAAATRAYPRAIL